MTQPSADGHPGYATAKDVARVYRVTIAYVYKLANRDGWRRYVLGGRTRYHRDDVDKSFNGGTAGADHVDTGQAAG